MMGVEVEVDVGMMVPEGLLWACSGCGVIEWVWWSAGCCGCHGECDAREAAAKVWCGTAPHVVAVEQGLPGHSVTTPSVDQTMGCSFG